MYLSTWGTSAARDSWPLLLRLQMRRTTMKTRQRQIAPSTLPKMMEVLVALAPSPAFTDTSVLPGLGCAPGPEALEDGPLMTDVIGETIAAAVVVLSSLTPQFNRQKREVTGCFYRGASQIPEKQVQL